MSNIIFCYPSLTSFVQKDMDILRQNYQVIPYEFMATKKWQTPFAFIRQLIFLIKDTDKNSIYLSQFAGYHSFLPSLLGKFLRKKHFIILGGTDCNWLPSISYGNYNKVLLRWATKYSLKNAYHLVPVNKELVACTYTYTKQDFQKQGYKSFSPNINTPYTVIPNGIDLAKYRLDEIERIPASFITICSLLDDTRRRMVKGIDLIIELAKLHPDINISIVGGSFPEGFDVPKNITTLPFIANEALPHLLNQYSFYLQLSLTEGFPNALIEAMACGCVPIVSHVGAMPDIVEKDGFILKTKDINQLSNLVKTALTNYSSSDVSKNRKIAEKYDLQVRKKLLLNLLSDHLSKVRSPL